MATITDQTNIKGWERIYEKNLSKNEMRHETEISRLFETSRTRYWMLCLKRQVWKDKENRQFTENPENSNESKFLRE